MPVNALSAGETYTEQQTLDDLNTENSNSTNESNATSAEVATDSNALEEASISDISSNDIEADALERMLSSEEKLNNEISLQSDNTEDEEEPSTDNWELGLVFYDSTVDNGKTPLTSIDWDASDGGYGEGTPRVITVQINYKNTNAVTTYEPGELEISIPNLIYGTKPDNSWQVNHVKDGVFLDTSVIVGANDSTHTGYDWNFSTASTPSPNQQTYKFTNAVSIEEKSNFEGSIQIEYTITPPQEGVTYARIESEQFDDECTHHLNKSLQAEIKNIIKSNEITFNYIRTYTHPWQRRTYTVTKKANKINSYDGLGENAADYIWVKYSFDHSIKDKDLNRSWWYPYINTDKKEKVYKDAIPDECVVYDTSGNKLVSTGGTYIFPATTTELYVGYPKSIYNEQDGTLNVTNSVELWGTYNDRTEQECLATNSVSLNLAEFDFIYSGNLYGIDKSIGSYLRYQDIVNNKTYNYIESEITPIAYYTGIPMTVEFGDDVLFVTSKNGDIVKLEDNEYYFYSIKWSNSYFKNGNGNTISSGKYDCELWVRYKNSDEYTLYEQFKNGYGGDKSTYNQQGSGNWTFTEEDGVVGFYFIAHDVKEGLIGTAVYNRSDKRSYYPIEAKTKLLKKDIPEQGYLYNFDYIQVYFKDADNNLMLQNTVGLDSYTTRITKEKIAQYDLETYGHYMQRDTASGSWRYFNVTQPTYELEAKKSFSSVTQDSTNELFFGACTVSAGFEPEVVKENYPEQYDSAYAVKGFRLYDLLPIGMELTSSEEEIIKSLSHSNVENYLFYDTNFNKITNENFDSKIRNEVKITHNWKDTGRTKIEIIGEFEEPIYMFKPSPSQSYTCSLNYTYNYNISYDSFLEYGKVWKNYCYVDKLESQEKGINLYNSIQDNGRYDSEASDINENGDLTDKLSYTSASTTINSIVSTHQDVTKYVQTDKSNYSTGTVKASPDSEYTYKLRVRTGSADVTNFVIYDSIEKYVQDPYSTEQSFITAYGTKDHWNGEFLGVDTSYAENKGYKVKVYYSEDEQAGNLSEDNSWKEYSDSVDKSKVKSLAFEYLNKEDESLKAVLPANSQTYVLVKMKAPPEEIRKILAYNGCRTQWQALDDYENPVDFITGINSNIVKVGLSDYFDLTVNKTWDDENNKYEFRPDSVDIILKKSGVEIDRKSITKENLSVTFTDLLLDDAKFYTIEEEPLQNYKSSIEYNEIEDCYEVTNTLKDDVFTDISGTKIWVGDKEANRPKSITIKLLKDGEIYRTTTTNAEKEWEYIFPKVPIYNADGTECVYSVEEVPVEKYSVQYTTPSNGLAIKFDNQFKFEGTSTDYIEIYYKDKENNIYKMGKYGGTSLAGKTVNVPSKDFYIYFYSDGSVVYYGYKVESIIPAKVDENSITRTEVTSLPSGTLIELSGNNYPETEHNYKNSQRLLWHYTGLPDTEFNIINIYEGVDAINLSFVKEVKGTDEAFEKLQLKKDDLYKFQISMKNRNTGNTISVPIDNKNTVTVNEVPVGTYVITEKDDMYFDFVSMEALNSVEGVTFEKVGNDYVLTITENASEEETLQIKVNNKIESDRPYEDKKERVNLFDWTSDENSEEASLLSRIANFFKN